MSERILSFGAMILTLGSLITAGGCGHNHAHNSSELEAGIRHAVNNPDDYGICQTVIDGTPRNREDYLNCHLVVQPGSPVNMTMSKLSEYPSPTSTTGFLYSTVERGKARLPIKMFIKSAPGHLLHYTGSPPGNITFWAAPDTYGKM